MKRRLRHGEPPVSHVSVVSFFEGKWLLYERWQHTGGWRSFKLVHQGQIRGGANYWLGWNGYRLSRNVDFDRLREYRPGLLVAVLAYLAHEHEGGTT